MTRTKKVLLTVAVLGVALHYWLVYLHVPDWEPIWTSTSPDGRFTASVYANDGLVIRLFNMPGNSTAGAGTIVIRESKTGKVLKRINMNLITTDKSIVRWFGKSNSFGITSIGVWDLPPPEPTTP